MVDGILSRATAPLDTTELFDRHPGKIRLFLAHVEDQAQCFNWQDILTIPVGNPPLNYNHIQDYGRITLQDVQNKVQTYVGQQVQNAQDSYMLHLFIIESLTDTLKSSPSLCSRLHNHSSRQTTAHER